MGDSDYAIPVDKDVGFELRRLEIDSAKPFDVQKIHLPALLESSLLEKGNVFALIDKLFRFDSPYVELGENLVFKKTLDHYGTTSHIHLRGEEWFENTPLLTVVHQDSGLDNLAGNLAWGHRTDISVGEIGMIISDAYKTLHEHTLKEVPNFTDRFSQEDRALQLQVLYGDDFAQYTCVAPTPFALPENSAQFETLVSREDFYSATFANSVIPCGIGGNVGFYDSMHKYGKDGKMVFVRIGVRDEIHDYIGSWIQDLMGKTSFREDLKLGHLDTYLRSLNPNGNLLLE